MSYKHHRFFWILQISVCFTCLLTAPYEDVGTSKDTDHEVGADSYEYGYAGFDDTLRPCAG